MPTFHGPSRPERRDTPILLAAVGPILSRVAGEVADGLVGHPLASPRFLREAVAPRVAEGLTLAGRETDACPITATVLVSVDTDREEARRAARLQIAFYATTPSYKAMLELHDRADLPRHLRRAFVSRDLERMANLVDDELLDAVAVAGTPDEATARLAAWEGIAARAILGVPWYGLDADGQRRALEGALDLGARLVRG
jgi:alkanesulfonate monooxygenase SsuD/methylene tetrahydromethanopterin reductase-like flavin-dependent oxidoreductase (luciferase family)